MFISRAPDELTSGALFTKPSKPPAHAARDANTKRPGDRRELPGRVLDARTLLFGTDHARAEPEMLSVTA